MRCAMVENALIFVIHSFPERMVGVTAPNDRSGSNECPAVVLLSEELAVRQGRVRSSVAQTTGITVAGEFENFVQSDPGK